jgi:hypothetical protein
MTRSAAPRLRLDSPADLLAAVPYLLGFHPQESLVVVGGPPGRLTFAGRIDLPAPAQPPAEFARHLAGVVARQALHTAVLIGYGALDRVEPALLATREALRGDRLRLVDVLRVSGGRYWSYECQDPHCCPPDGTAFDGSTSAVSAAAAFAGAVALPDRAALLARLAPVRGAARVSMRAATDRAAARLAEQARGGPLMDPATLVCAGGQAAVREAIERQRSGGSLTDDEVAWLTVVLRVLPVRDFAWEQSADPPLAIALWSDVVRRADPPLVAPPASLLALVAWHAGEGVLASAAVDRALAAEPDYSLALLLDSALRHGLPPSTMEGWPGVDPRALRLRRPRRSRRSRLRA